MNTSIKNFIDSIRDFFQSRKRYTIDRNSLTLCEDNLIKKLIFICLGILIVTGTIIYIQHYQNIKHKAEALSHYEKIIALQDSISEQKYIENEISLYTEIGLISVQRNCEPCNEQNICEYIDYLADMGVIWYPDIIKSNCKIESNFGSSNVARKYNNLFGMDHPNSRKTLSLYCSGRFATFKNWKCSILDRVLWDYATFKGKIPSKKTYLEVMGNKYNTENSNYSELLTACM